MVKKTIKFDIYIKTSEQTPTYSYTAKQKVMSNDKDSTQITFNLLDVAPEELSGSSASILLYMEDGSFFQKSDVTINRNSVIYTMKPEETRHSGNTKVQIVLNKGTVQTASLIYHFEIERGLEKFPIVEKEIQDWTTLTAEAKAFVEQIKDFTLEGFVENKMGEELANLETNYATRLTGLEQKDNQLTAQLAQTASKSEVDAKVAQIVSGAPKGTYATLDSLQAAKPTGDTGIYVVTADGKWYYWNGATWTAGSVYQSTGIADNSISVPNLTNELTKNTINIFDKNNMVKNGYYNFSTGGWNTNTSYDSVILDVMPGEYVTFSNFNGHVFGFHIAYFNADMTFINGASLPVATYKKITVPSNSLIRKMSVSVNKSFDLSNEMIVKGEQPSSYIPYKVIKVKGYNLDDSSIGGEKIVDKSIPVSKISLDSIGKQNGYNLLNSYSQGMDYFILSYDIGSLGLSDSFITVESEYKLSNASNVKDITTMAARRATSTGYNADLASEKRNYFDTMIVKDTFTNFTSTGNYLILVLTLGKNTTSTMSLNVDYTRVKVNGIEVEPVNRYFYTASQPSSIDDVAYKDNTILTHRDLVDIKPRTPWYGKTIMTFGDSITEGTEGGYVKYIQEITQASISNKGASGSVAARMVGAMTHIKSRNQYSPPATPDYTNVSAVTMMIGTNDYIATTEITGIPYAVGKSVDSIPFDVTAEGVTTTIDTEDKYWSLFANDYISNIALCIEYVRFKNPKTLIFLISPPYNANSPSKMDDARQAMINLGNLYGIPVIDAQRNAGIDKKHLHKYMYDLIHFNLLGNELWGKYVASKIVTSYPIT